MAFFGAFIVGALIAVLVRALIPRPPDQKPASLDELNFPTAEEGKPVPVIFGTVTLQSPNVVWYGDFRYSRVRSQGTTIGYKYFIGMHMNFGHTPSELIRIRAGKKDIFNGSITSNTTLNIDEPGLFGGRKKQGGIVGAVDVLFGEPTQTQNAYLQTQLGNDIPAFRGTCGLVLNQAYVTAITTNIQPWDATWRSFPAQIWYPARANINSGSANPAHIIYEALTNNDWGLGLPISDLDDASFRAAADTLFSENFGLSFPYVAQNQIEEFIQTVDSHISGLTFIDKFTGTFKIRLFRDDYTVGSLPVFDNSNCELQKFERPGLSELINEVNLVYRKRGETDDSSLSFQDLAGIEGAGEIISQTVQYPGIDNADLAARVADRDLLQLASPLASVQLVCNRQAFQLTEGDLIVLNYTSDDVSVSNLVIRVMQINLGTLDRSEIVVDGTQDVFSLGTATYFSDQPPQWVDPVQDPVEATDKNLQEMSYWDIINVFGTAEVNTLTSTSSYLQTRVGQPSVASPNYELFTALTGDDFLNVDDGAYPPTALLLNNENNRTATDFQINPNNINQSDIEDIQIGSYIAINNELMQLAEINLTAVPATITVVRGVIDSVPIVHAQGDTIYFVQNFLAIDPKRYNAGQEIGAKIIVETGQGQLDIATAVITNLTFTARQNRPYPPGFVRFNNVLFPERINAQSVITTSWAERNRITQGSSLINWTDSTNFAFEQGTTVTIEFRGETDSLLRTEIGLTSSYFYPIADEQIDSNLFTFATNRVLRTTELAIATQEQVYNGITDPTITILSNTAFRRMTNDWALFQQSAQYFLHFVDNVSGLLTSSSVTFTQWEAIPQNSTTAFNGRSDAELILEENAGQQAGWAAIIPNISFTTVAPDAIDRTPLSIRDHRASSDQLITGFTSETTFNFVANGQSAIKGIAFFSHSLHFASRTDLVAGSFGTTRRLIEEFYSANAAMLDDATVPSSSLTSPAVESPYATYSTVAVRPLWGGITFGSLLYVTYRGFGSNSFSTSGKFLDITNLLTGHLANVYSSHQVITKKYTVSGDTITQVNRFTDFVFADRSNVADTQGVEWEDTSMRLVNSATGAVTNTFAKFAINALACDWVDGHVFVIRRSDLAVVKLDLTGVELATLANPGFVSNPHFTHLYIADNFIYTKVGINVIKIDKNLTTSSTTVLASESILPTFPIQGLPIDARPDSNLIHNWNASRLPDLYDENGGESAATPIPQARLNTSLRIDVKSVRGGIDSLRTLTHTIQRTGYGYNYGNFYGE